MKVLVPGVLSLCITGAAIANPVGYWRFDDPGASAGGAVNPISSVNDADLNTTVSGAPIYSADVPGSMIFDPVSGSSVANNFSMDSAAAFSRLNVDNHALLNASTDFTVEFFIRLKGEPASYESYVQRLDTTHTVTANDPSRNYRRWQMDFDHGTQLTTGYGEARARFDTYDPSLVVTDPVEGQTDFNKVVHGNHLFIDTDTGSNDVNDYTGPDPFTEGDTFNDDSSTWHHLALTVSNNVVSLFMDYQAAPASELTLAGTYVHPDGQLRFGKLGSATYGLDIDEFRYSDSVLKPNEFLMAIPEPGPAGLLVFGGLLLHVISIRRKRA